MCDSYCHGTASYDQGMKRESMITGLLLAICGITQLHGVTPTTMASTTSVGENGNAMFNLDAYQWKNRLLLVFADNADDAYKQQIQLLATQTGLAERDLLLVQVLTQGTSRLSNQVLAPEVAKQLRSRFNV